MFRCTLENLDMNPLDRQHWSECLIKASCSCCISNVVHFWYQKCNRFLNCRVAKTWTQNMGGVQLIILRLFFKICFYLHILDFNLPYFTESIFPWKKKFQLCTNATKVPWFFGSIIPLSSLEVGDGLSVFLQLFQIIVRILSHFQAGDFWVDKL